MAYLSSVRAVCAALAILFFWTNAAKADTAVVAVDLNLRSGPGFEYPVILTIPGGSILDAEECEYGWCYAYWTDYEGYVSEEYLQFGAYAGYAQGYIPPPVIVNRYYPSYSYTYYRDDRRSKAYRYKPRHNFAPRGNGRAKQVHRAKPRRNDVQRHNPRRNKVQQIKPRPNKVHKRRAGNKSANVRGVPRKAASKKVRQNIRKAIKPVRKAVRNNRGKPKARGGPKRKQAARGGGKRQLKRSSRGKKAKARNGGPRKAEKRERNIKGKGGKGRKRG